MWTHNTLWLVISASTLLTESTISGPWRILLGFEIKIREWPGDKATKVYNSVKLDVRSSEWDDTCCMTCAWDTVDRNRKFSEIKRSKMLQLVQKGKSLVHTLTRSAQCSCKEASLSCTLSQAHIRIKTIPSTKIFNHSAHFLCCSIVQPLRGPTH